MAAGSSIPPDPVAPHRGQGRGFLSRFGDLLVIGGLAVGLLGVAIWLSSAPPRGHAETPAHTRPAPASEEPPPHWVPLPGQGLELTREIVPGEQALAVQRLDQLCDEVLSTPEEWVLSLTPTATELDLLQSVSTASPLLRPTPQPPTGPQTFVYTLGDSLGRLGLLRREAGPAGSGNSAAGERVLCWGLVQRRPDGGHTVWFARPSERLVRSSSQGPP